MLNMAPLIQDTDLHVSSYDDVFEHKSMIAPLHQSSTRVSFGATVDMCEVMSRSEYTQEELKASWFDRDELRRMKENTKSEGKLVEQGLLLNGPDVSIRGLEAKTRAGMKRKRQNRLNAYAAVFFEIDRQEYEGYFDEDLIADAYFNYSEQCAVSAQMIGKRDEVEAKDLYNYQKTDFFGTTFCQGIVNLPTPASSAA